MDKIVVLDFGGQYTHLIANRIRRLNVYSEILPGATNAADLKGYKGIILSGGPQSVYDKNAPKCDPKIFKLKIPILGICYGHQLIAHALGGKIKGETKEYGFAMIRITNHEEIFEGLNQSEEVWMSHGDSIKKLPRGISSIAFTSDCENAAIADFKRKIFGLQFHPEVTHTPCGTKILGNFIKICKCKPTWNLKDFVKKKTEEIRNFVGSRQGLTGHAKKVFLLVSGGVDSTVTFLLLDKALGQGNVYGLFVDTGFMRKNERAEVESALRELGLKNLHVQDAGKEFFEALKNVCDPEQKRKIIGDLFIKIQQKVVKELKLNPDQWLLGQGTIYPDTIESGGTRHADKIKTHHNRVQEIQNLIAQGKVIEPIKDLYKDEVREIGLNLGLSAEFVFRHPFPGPGLAVRCLCAGKKNYPNDKQQLEGHIRNFLKEHFATGSDQYFPLRVKILPIQSVGVQGDARTYRHPLALFCEFPGWSLLGAMATVLTNKFKEINRVLYCLSSDIKISNIEVGLCYSSLTPDRINLLRDADKIVMDFIRDEKIASEIWQFPTVLLPISVANTKNPKGESLVLRPVSSQEAMTANFYQMNPALLEKLTAKLLHLRGISAVFYDLTNKPPGTIEWE